VETLIERLLGNLYDRVSGPMWFRLILQPAMAVLFAVRAGRQDGLTGRPPYLWAILTSPEHRRDLVREGWKDVAKIFVMAVAIDIIYQIINLRWFYPTEAVIVAVVLAFVPYLLIRGLVGRIVRIWSAR
jgi:hypothetical protein